MPQKVIVAGVSMTRFARRCRNGNTSGKERRPVVAAPQKFTADGNDRYDGRLIASQPAGLFFKGHPVDASGLAQRYDLIRQLRSTADLIQVEGARIALQLVLGDGRACVATNCVVG